MAGDTHLSTAAALRGVILSAVTPFAADGTLDLPAFARVLYGLADQRPAAVAIAMDAGEGPSLREHERKALVTFAVRTLSGKCRVVADVSMAGTLLAADQARHAEEVGADAILLTTPYYWRPPELELIAHFVTVAQAVTCPVLVHSAPRRHKQHLHDMRLTAAMVATIWKAAPNVAGLVDASLHLPTFTTLRRQTAADRPGFLLFADDAYLTSTVALGGDGAFSVLGNVAPHAVTRLYDACRARDYVGARDLQHRIGHALRLLSEGSLAGNLKAAMAMTGMQVGNPRLPNIMPGGEVVARLHADLRETGLLQPALAD
jgi:4-hydroxy-tetrahydrodipicolinate synthase